MTRAARSSWDFNRCDGVRGEHGAGCGGWWFWLAAGGAAINTSLYFDKEDRRFLAARRELEAHGAPQVSAKLDG
jgi:hypothetical protein